MDGMQLVIKLSVLKLKPQLRIMVSFSENELTNKED